ncbi:hypothetical protein [Mycobacteroides abscessus]|uniref:hypothetical protein n=1 Tax=Mycobacteroides abscessus TaxID=36809 RepID=UPI0009A5793E|nr:hypothetical protein [Mycobacteroides abscessus]RIT48818.1 hypothetical protein D2E80_11985 [Mycobacteroides abscessus]SKT87679.1 Uncharacterised protein [Mycobacteroides abscessus subsp. massiliense]SKU07722.1 Uncharacterised protein [Mycobacteroides abscessus subsp. massiliense]
MITRPGDGFRFRIPPPYVVGTDTAQRGELSIGGATNTSWINNDLIIAVGFLSSGGDGTAVRITDVELLSV